MEYCEGGDLEAYLKTRQGVDEHKAVRLLTQLLVALKFIHGQQVSSPASMHTSCTFLLGHSDALYPTRVQVTHRDVKPANILLTAAGALKLADLGLARSLGESAAGTKSKSESKGAAGTFAYMPPEALANPPLRTLAGDVWSAGVVALQLASLEANLGSSPTGRGDLATVQKQVEERLAAAAGSVGQPYLEAVRLMLTFAHDERATASELLCETAFYDAAAELRAAKPDVVELHSLEEDAKKLAAKKQAAAAKLKAAAEAQAVAAVKAEVDRVRAGGCAAGAEHEWQWHQGTGGSGRACFKCLEVQDYTTGKAIWWCASVVERNRILAGGCPAEDPNQGSHAWEYRNGQKGSGRMCTRCGQTEGSDGTIILLPQLVGAFGPARANPHVGGR